MFIVQYQHDKKLDQATRSFFTLKFFLNKYTALIDCTLFHFGTQNREEK